VPIALDKESAYALVGTIYELTSLKPPFFGHMDDDDLRAAARSCSSKNREPNYVIYFLSTRAAP
jgi:hypothetical protein